VPSHPARDLDNILKVAGIPKQTAEGKVAFHGLRTSFVTMACESGATHEEAQELTRHSTPGLAANRYVRTRNERLAGITERIADAVRSGETGTNTAHKTESSVTTKVVKLLPVRQLTKDSDQWRRGDPNPICIKTEPLHTPSNSAPNPNGKPLKCGFEKQDHNNPEHFQTLPQHKSGANMVHEDIDLRRIVEAWPALPPQIKATIKTLIQIQKKGDPL